MTEDKSYCPVVMRNLEEIAAVMGVGKETVRRWHKEGAPIAMFIHPGGKPRYTANRDRLQEWLEIISRYENARKKS